MVPLPPPLSVAVWPAQMKAGPVTVVVGVNTSISMVCVVTQPLLPSPESEYIDVVKGATTDEAPEERPFRE